MYFWKASGTNGFLSNHFKAPHRVDRGLPVVPTAEHAFMYYKAKVFGDDSVAQAILKARHPQRAKQLGKSVSGFDQSVWDYCKEEWMEQVVKWKFRDAGLRDLLLNTGDAQLVEASPTDAVWGAGMSGEEARNGGAWNGLNLLGSILMRVRSSLREEKEEAAGPMPSGRLR